MSQLPVASKQLLKKSLPPIVLDGLRLLVRRQTTDSQPTFGSERGPEWYDESFERAQHYREHYSQSRYFFMWSVIADRIIRSGVQAVLDLGSGPGQFAALLRDRGVDKYWGLDFSERRIAQARHVCPEFDFFVEDVFLTNKLETLPYQAVVMTEFLEHIESDKALLARIRPGTTIFGTVPNFPFDSHVRHFDSAEQVQSRYEDALEDLVVDTLIANNVDKRYFLLEGVKA